jgi:hypothetical protein
LPKQGLFRPRKVAGAVESRGQGQDRQPTGVAHVLAVLQGAGDDEPVRLSVFLCRITATDLVSLKAHLEEIIEPKEDQVIFIRLCGACAVDIETFGVPTPAHDA